MHANPIAGGSGPWTRRLRRCGLPMRLAACFASITFASAVVPWVERWEPQNNLLWVANGLFLAYLLLAPRWRWPAYLITGFLALSLRILFMPTQWSLILLYNLLDMIEVGTAALLLRPHTLELPRFTERAYLFRFIAYGVLAGPLMAGAVYALVLPILGLPIPPSPFLNWAASDSLGIAISTPAFVAVFRTRLRDTVDWRRQWFYPAMLLAVTLAAFTQNTLPLIYLIYPLLVVVLVRLGLGYASLCTLFVTAIAGWLTIHGSGPFANPDATHPAIRALNLQIAIAAAMLLISIVSVVLESRNSIERRLKKIASLHTLVTENSRDIILLADFEGLPRYISPAVFSLTGWKPEETMKRSFADVVHSEDLPQIEALIGKLRGGAESGTIEYRVRRRNGGYVWVEGSFRSVCDLGTSVRSGILQIVRDITERKQADQKLKDAYNAVEALAASDALTGLANRRRFDQVLSSEWRRGLRDHHPLSLLMIDADLFKSYNDAYGHMRGDSCLKQIAEAAQDVVARPGDLVARFGGEEFAVILPNTGSDGALQLGLEVCEAMRARRLPHIGKPSGIVTVSVGCATLQPTFGLHAVNLVELADEALYEAKHRGRDQVVDADAIKGGSCAFPHVGLQQATTDHPANSRA